MSPLARALNQYDWCSSKMRKLPGEDPDTQGEQGHGKMHAETGVMLSQVKELARSWTRRGRVDRSMAPPTHDFQLLAPEWRINFWFHSLYSHRN